MDASQAFDKVWHTGILYKLKRVIPHNYYLILNSYLSDRYFSVKHNNELSNLHPIQSGVPQGSVLGPYLYLIYTADIPTTTSTEIAMFADDTAILSINENPDTATENLQFHLNLLGDWLLTWRIKVNHSKSAQVTFTTRHSTCPPVTLNTAPIPVKTEAKYLGLHLDQRLTWKRHIEAKRNQLNLKYRQLYWLLGRKSKLSVKNKVLVYNSILKPIWSYGLPLWGCAKPTRLKSIQQFQSKVLRSIVNAPWYVTNQRIHEDLRVPFIHEEIHSLATRYHEKLSQHRNELVALLSTDDLRERRLNRKWPHDLLT